MQTQSVLLLVLVGAVVVLAKKGSSSEEDRNVYGYGNAPHQAWPFPKPNRGPKPYRFKGKHQIPILIMGRPQHFHPQRPHFPQEAPYYPQPPQESEFPQGLNPFQLQEYFMNIQRQMQDYSANAYKDLQTFEIELENERNNFQENLKSEFQALEKALEEKQANEIQDAVKEGKDESKIQECLAKEEQEIRQEINADIDRTLDCMNDAHGRARRVVTAARNRFTEESIMISMQAKELAMKIKYCSEQRDERCVQEGLPLFNDKIKSAVEARFSNFANLPEARKQQMIQFDYCRQNFMDYMKDMRDSYSKTVSRCVIASEISKPEEESSEKDAENVQLDIAVKPGLIPEVEAEGNVEVDA